MIGRTHEKVFRGFTFNHENFSLSANKYKNLNCNFCYSESYRTILILRSGCVHFARRRYVYMLYVMKFKWIGVHA